MTTLQWSIIFSIVIAFNFYLMLFGPLSELINEQPLQTSQLHNDLQIELSKFSQRLDALSRHDDDAVNIEIGRQKLGQQQQRLAKQLETLENAILPLKNRLDQLQQRVESQERALAEHENLRSSSTPKATPSPRATTVNKHTDTTQATTAPNTRKSDRFHSNERPAERLWEGKGDTGNDPHAQRYVDELFVYKAPPLPTLSRVAEESRRARHAKCAEYAQQSDALSDHFKDRFLTRTANYLLREDDASEMQAFFDDLYNRQHPKNCATARLLLYPQNQDCGIGAELHWMQMALTAAYHSKRTLVVREDQGWSFVDPVRFFYSLFATASQFQQQEFCGEKSFSCYFKPLSGCDVHNDHELNRLLHDYDEWPPTVTTSNYSAPELDEHRVLHWKNNRDFKFSRFMPDDVRRHNGRRDLFWWRSMLMRYQVRPQPLVEQFAQSAAQRIGTSSRQLSMHIRGGDKIHGNRYNRVETNLAPSTEKLFDELAVLAELCDFERVFVSTRDPAIIERMKQWQRQRQEDGGKLHFVWDNDELRYGNGFHTLDLLNRKLNVTEEGLNAVKDILLLLDSDLFVGMMDSNFSRLVAELGVALRRFAEVPMRATDTGWIIVP